MTPTDNYRKIICLTLDSWFVKYDKDNYLELTDFDGITWTIFRRYKT